MRTFADLARARLALGDRPGAIVAATLAFEFGVPCPFGDPDLIAAWDLGGALRARVQARRLGDVPAAEPTTCDGDAV